MGGTQAKSFTRPLFMAIKSALSKFKPRNPLTRRRIFCVLVIVLAAWLMFVLELSTAVYVYGTADYARSVDVIIVLGSGLLDDGSPGPALTRRSSHAAELWHQGVAPSIICTGGRTNSASRSEASACQEVLQSHDIPSAAIVLEDDSRSTEENAINSQAIMDSNGWETAVLVSDSYHVFRANWIFELEGLTVYTSPVPARQVSIFFYSHSIAREVLALHWQAMKELLNLPVTYIGGM